MKILQYIKIVLIAGPVILYDHFRYNRRFAKHPEKYPLEYRYAQIRKEITFVLKLFGVDYNKKNFDLYESYKGKSLIISNHLSLADPMCLIAKSERPLTFMVKKEVLKMPFAGVVAKALDVFPIDRANLMSQLSVIKEVVGYLKDPSKPSVVVYIEGTRNKEPQNPCLEFHPGTLKIAQMAGVPLISYATYGTFRVLSKKSYLHKYPVYLSFLKKYEVEELKKIPTPELASILKNEVDTEVDILRAEDKDAISKMKISSKRKELETRVDARVNA